MAPLTSWMVCAGCGYQVPLDELYPFRCPRALPDDDIDHVLTKNVDSVSLASTAGSMSTFDDGKDNPFVRFRGSFLSHSLAFSRGLSDRDYVNLVKELDSSLASVDGRGFRVTPLVQAEGLQHLLGLAPGGSLWIKDETENVSGTHKGRHLMGILLWLEVAERSRLGGIDRWATRRLAIASCGNAALAAAVLAQAGGRELEVFVPPHAEASILERFRQLGADVSVCPRQSEGSGDPCVLRFRDEVAAGALPFACQGNENGLAIEGGETLGYEIVDAMVARDRKLDRIFVQVGGGALASACIQALYRERKRGRIERLPRFHSVQTEGAYPLSLAYGRVVERILEHYRREAKGPLTPPEKVDELARFIQEHVPSRLVEEELRYAATHRSPFMQPWPTTPQSVAEAILDDETYDWLEVVRGMLVTGGFPVVVTEERLREAHRAAHRHTEIRVDPTGTAGFAAALELAECGILSADETVVVLFTGVERSRKSS